MRKIIAIAAIGNNNELGKNNDLLWHLPNDFKRFKTLTSGHYIIMGRKTFESFPKPLPNRTHVVITNQKDYQTNADVIVVESLEKAIEQCPTNEDIFIIGGGQIYQQAMEFCNVLELTHVNASFIDAEVYFPKINKQEWHLNFECYHPKDDKHQFDFWFRTYVRKG